VWAANVIVERLFAIVSEFVAVLCTLLAITGPAIRAAADAQEARTIDQENRTFCSQLGVGPETRRYADCAAGLMEIRERHLKRNLSDSIL
jgi:ABC-type Fe2+-enterobactin transport system substrate-binding protein